MSGTLSFASLETRRYQAPQEHGEILAIPELGTAIQSAQQNSEQLSTERIEIGSIPLAILRQQSRAEVITRAVEWTNTITGQNLACAECSHHASLLYVTGHQPQLAHPGVWAKNFAASGLAKSSQGIGLNIIVDNDTVGKQSIRVPEGTREEPRNVDVYYDTDHSQQPWEELKVSDQKLFETFAERVHKLMSNWGVEPLVTKMWPDAVEASNQTRSMAAVLSATRMQQERRWDGGNLEVPLSELCRTDSFLVFASHLFLNAKAFHESYNTNVDAYRRENGIRNDRHPVPNLERSGNAYELPFWYWNEGDSERGRLFACQSDGMVELTCHGKTILHASPEDLLSKLKSLQEIGKLRTRALTTTLFARLCLADLFIHGIGGAKYDEMTDRLIADFFGIAPPSYLVLSATLQLPIEKFDVTESEVHELRAQLRDYEFNADRYLDGTSDEVSELVAQKQKLIQEHWAAQTNNLSKRERIQRRYENRKRHRKLKAVHAKLYKLAQPQVERLRDELSEKENLQKANMLLKSREYSSVLFEEATVRKLAQQLMNPVVAHS